MCYSRNISKESTRNSRKNKKPTDRSSNTIGTAENNGNVDFTTRHIIRFGSRVDDLIDSLHGEIKSHEFNNRTQSLLSSTNSKTSEAHLSNGSIDNTISTIFLVQVL